VTISARIPIHRLSLEETEALLARKQRPSTPEIVASMARHWTIVLLGMMLVVMTTVSFYAITAYTPTFSKNVLKLTITDSLVVTSASACPTSSGCLSWARFRTRLAASRS
jgi:MFS transporter, MHS family, citrate/tricarballylate:H+ symporter